MTLATAGWGHDGLAYSGKDMRQLAQGLAGVNGIAGVAGVTQGYKVSAQGSPNATVSVALGWAFLFATGSGLFGSYHVWNDAALNSPSFTATTTNGRKDRLILRVTAGVPALEIVQGTASGSPAEPSITGDNYLELALVTLPSSTTNITNAMLTDRRVFVGKWAQPWGRLVAASGTESATTSSSGSTGAYVDSAVSATYTRVFNRRYLYVVEGHLASTGATTEVGGASLRRSSTVLRRTDRHLPAQNFASGFDIVYEETASSAGSDTVKVSVTRSNGAGSHILFADAERPLTLRVYDEGPAGNPD